MSKDVAVWPENERAVQIFIRMGTQWRIGMGGPTGFDYTSLYPLLDRAARDPDEWDDLFEDVRLMETTALQVIAVDRKD